MTNYIVSLKQFSLVRKLREKNPDFKFIRSNKMRRRVLDYNKDVIIHPPVGCEVRNAPDNYTSISSFVYASKKIQRSLLNSIVKTPESYEPYENLFIHRPNSHMGAKDYTVVTNDNLRDYQQKEGYLSPVYHKKNEYRVIYVRGKPVVTLLKRPVKEIKPYEPYNYGNTNFVTVMNKENDRLRHVPFYQDMEKFFKSFPLAIAAVDVGVNLDQKTYAVFEINTLPSIDIESNLDKIYNALMEEIEIPNVEVRSELIPEPMEDEELLRELIFDEYNEEVALEPLSPGQPLGSYIGTDYSNDSRMYTLTITSNLTPSSS